MDHNATALFVNPTAIFQRREKRTIFTIFTTKTANDLHILPIRTPPNLPFLVLFAMRPEPQKILRGPVPNPPFQQQKLRMIEQ
jgi:hypothetical protein